MTKHVSLGAVHTHTHTHTHTLCSYQKNWKRICTLLSKKFFAGRILLSVLGIEYKNKIIAGIDCIIVSVCKRNIYDDMVYPFLRVKNRKVNC